MSMDFGVYGLRDMDGEFKKMMKIKKMCEANDVSYPKEVDKYFNGAACLDEDVLISEMLRVEIPNNPGDEESEDKIEIEVKDIPKKCKTIRFYINY